jgi:hypothetical protein
LAGRNIWTAQSFVPLGTKTSSGQFDIQSYPTTTDMDPGGEVAIVSASISNWGHSPEAAWVDSAKVEASLQVFPGFSAKVLVLTVNIGVIDGNLNRVAYQVTAFSGATPDQLLNRVVHIDPFQKPT